MRGDQQEANVGPEGWKDEDEETVRISRIYGFDRQSQYRIQSTNLVDCEIDQLFDSSEIYYLLVVFLAKKCITYYNHSFFLHVID